MVPCDLDFVRFLANYTSGGSNGAEGANVLIEIQCQTLVKRQFVNKFSFYTQMPRLIAPNREAKEDETRKKETVLKLKAEEIHESHVKVRKPLTAIAR